MSAKPLSLPRKVNANDFFSSSFVGVSKERIISFEPRRGTCRGHKFMKWKERQLKKDGVVQDEEVIDGVLIEKNSGVCMKDLCRSLQMGETQVEVDRNYYQVIKRFVQHEKVKLKQDWVTFSDHVTIDHQEGLGYPSA